MYQYKAKVEKVIDGDTIEFAIDLGFHMYFREQMRLADYAAPEIEGSERPLGSIAKEMLEGLLPVGTVVIMNSKKTDKYGRWLADISWEGTSLSNYLIELGYGVAWNKTNQNNLKFDPSQPYPIIQNK